MYYYLMRILNHMTELKKEERKQIMEYKRILKESFIQKVLPYLKNKKGLLTEVLTWEGGIEQRFSRGIGRKEL